MTTQRGRKRRDPGSPALGVGILLGGAALLVYDWTANGLPESCSALTPEACWRAYVEGGGLLRFSGVILATLGAIYLTGFAIQMIAIAKGIGRRGPE